MLTALVGCCLGGDVNECVTCCCIVHYHILSEQEALLQASYAGYGLVQSLHSFMQVMQLYGPNCYRHMLGASRKSWRRRGCWDCWAGA